MNRILPIGLVFLTSACGGVVEGTSTTKGEATYVKPADEGGEKVAAPQDDGDLRLELAVTGQGTFESVDASLCALTSGEISTRVSTTGSVGADGAYASSFATVDASDGASNPLCGALKNVKLTSVTSITMTGSVPANEASCDAFCAAQAEDECGGDADETACTTTVEADCAATCSGSERITGSGTASQEAVADADTGARESGDVHAKVDLVLTDLE